MDVVNQDHTRRSLSWWKDTKSSRCGVSNKCQKLCQDAVAESCQDDAKWNKEEEEEEEEVQNMWKELTECKPCQASQGKHTQSIVRLLGKLRR